MIYLQINKLHVIIKITNSVNFFYILFMHLFHIEKLSGAEYFKTMKFNLIIIIGVPI